MVLSRAYDKNYEADTGCGLCATGLWVGRANIICFGRNRVQNRSHADRSNCDRYRVGVSENNCDLRQARYSHGRRHFATGCVIVIHELQSFRKNSERGEGRSVQSDCDSKTQNRQVSIQDGRVDRDEDEDRSQGKSDQRNHVQAVNFASLFNQVVSTVGNRNLRTADHF